MDSRERLTEDLLVLSAMAGEMDEYLASDTLFWQMMKGGMPRLTLGGFLFRQHRLWMLRHLLSPEERPLLETAMRQFNQSLVEKIVRFEQKAHRELEARLRQWGEYLKDLEWEKGAAAASYSSAVETRAIIQALIEKLEMAPYKLNDKIGRQVKLVDANLHRRWESGKCVWPDAWQAAYPQSDYWWLYGRPH